MSATFSSAPEAENFAVTGALESPSVEAATSPLTLFPVRLPMTASIRSVLPATFGWIATESTHTGSLASSSMRPTIPFQLVWVWSVTLCALRPTSIL